MMGFFLSGLALRYVPLHSVWTEWLARGVLIGGSVGLLQAQVLSQVLPNTHRWMLRTTAAYSGATAPFFLVAALLEGRPTYGNAIEGAALIVSGTIMGALQAVEFRRQRARYVAWTGAVAVSWFAGALLPAQIPLLKSFSYFPNAVSLGLWGVCLGTCTLYPLARLTRARQ